MVVFPFFATIWEENITKFFYLPLINGVSEGTLVTCAAIHYFGFLGVDYLNETQLLLGHNILKRDILLFVFFGIGVVFALIS